MKVSNEELVRKMMKAALRLRASATREGFERVEERFGHGHPFDGPEFVHVPPFDGRGMGGRRMMGRERILVILAQYPEGVHQKDIMEEAGIGPSSLSELIDKLESDGYVEREPDPDDRRATLIFLTEKGKARAAEVEDEQDEMFKDYFRNFTEEDKQEFSDLLDKILK